MSRLRFRLIHLLLAAVALAVALTLYSQHARHQRELAHVQFELDSARNVLVANNLAWQLEEIPPGHFRLRVEDMLEASAPREGASFGGFPTYKLQFSTRQSARLLLVEHLPSGQTKKTEWARWHASADQSSGATIKFQLKPRGDESTPGVFPVFFSYAIGSPSGAHAGGHLLAVLDDDPMKGTGPLYDAIPNLPFASLDYPLGEPIPFFTDPSGKNLDRAELLVEEVAN